MSGHVVEAGAVDQGVEALIKVTEAEAREGRIKQIQRTMVEAEIVASKEIWEAIGREKVADINI